MAEPERLGIGAEPAVAMERMMFTSREQEPLEFRLVGGMEDRWEALLEPRRSALWNWVGVYPLAMTMSLWLGVTGALLLGSG